MPETVFNMDHYLNNPLYDDMYTGELRERIVRVRNEAESIRMLLDVPGPMPDDFVSPFTETDRPAIDRWKALSDAFLCPTVAGYVRARLASNNEWSEREREQLTADIAELQALE